MKFKLWKEAEYRSADLDALEKRKAEIAAELRNEESEVATADLEVEVKRCKDAISRIELAAEMKVEKRAAVAAGAGTVIDSNAPVVRSSATYAGVAAATGAKPADRFDTPEYRNAFMEYVCRGTQMPEQYRSEDFGTVAKGTTLSTGVSPQVPTTMQQEIVSAMREYGTIWNEVRKTAVQGGIWFRVIDIVPTATWLQENNVSEYQKVTNDAKISFSFFELECRMSQSLLAAAVTFADFQAMFVPAVAEAMVTAIEAAIMNGDGTKQPLGILKDPRVLTKTNPHDPRKVAVIELSEAEFGDWNAWHKKVKANIPSLYRNGKFYMNYATFDCYIETMSDDNNAPVSNGYNPVTGEEVSRLVGIPVEKVNDTILKDFATASEGDVVAVYGDMRNYIVNTQPGMPLSTVKWVDHETNTEKIKSIVALDGKVLNPYGFIVIKKGAAA